MIRWNIINLNKLFITKSSFNIVYVRPVSNKEVEKSENETKENQPTFLDEFEEEAPNPNKFNKSRLQFQHRNILHESLPYNEPHIWSHLTEKYQRKLYGRYGKESGVNPRICFKTKTEISDQTDYENIVEPLSLQEMIVRVRTEQEKKKEKIVKRENEILAKLEKLDRWKSELNAKIAKKTADALAAKERKDRLIEEVRRHFGFKVDARDERFKELLEQKEKEDRKKQKEAKRKAKEEKMLSKLIERNENTK